jgi:hypothetical protein
MVLPYVSGVNISTEAKQPRRSSELHSDGSHNVGVTQKYDQDGRSRVAEGVRAFVKPHPSQQGRTSPSTKLTPRFIATANDTFELGTSKDKLNAIAKDTAGIVVSSKDRINANMSVEPTRPISNVRTVFEQGRITTTRIPRKPSKLGRLRRRNTTRVTVQFIGRLGNNMFQYACLIALAKRHNFQAFLPKYNPLSSVFNLGYEINIVPKVNFPKLHTEIGGESKSCGNDNQIEHLDIKTNFALLTGFSVQAGSGKKGG